MATGKVTVNDEGDKYTYYFDKSGKAYKNTLIKGAIYGADGRRLEAEDSSKYELIPVEAIRDDNGKLVKGLESGGLVIVNTNGTVKRTLLRSRLMALSTRL